MNTGETNDGWLKFTAIRDRLNRHLICRTKEWKELQRASIEVLLNGMAKKE